MKLPRNEKELRRIVHEMKMIERWQPGLLHDPVEAAWAAGLIHYFQASYVTPMRMRFLKAVDDGGTA